MCLTSFDDQLLNYHRYFLKIESMMLGIIKVLLLYIILQINMSLVISRVL